MAGTKSGTSYPVYPVRHVLGVLLGIILAVVTRGDPGVLNITHIIEKEAPHYKKKE